MVTQKSSTINFSINAVRMQGSEKWLNRLHAVIERNLNDPSLNNEQIAVALMVSERHLFRKVKELTNLPPQKYLSQYRLQRAIEYLRNGKFRTVKETCFAVGFRHTSYFISQFEKKFGLRPLQVLQESGWR